MRAPVVFAALLAVSAAPALADTIYKWVDDQGTVHYSNARPADASRRAEVLSEDRISVYSSEPPEVRAAAAARADAAVLARRVENLERELAAQRYAAAYAASGYSQCDPNCAPAPGYAAPYYPATVVYPGRILAGRRIAPVRGLRPVTGFTGVAAGNVVTFGAAQAPRSGRGFR